MKIKFDDFRRGINRKNGDNLIGLKEAKMCYNFDFSGGDLKSSLPFRGEFSGKIGEEGSDDDFTGAESDFCGGAIFYFKKFDFESNIDASKLIYVSPTHKFFYLNLYESDAKFVPLDINFTSKPSAVNYRLDSEDVIIFSSPTDNMVVWDGVSEPQVVVDAPKITSMCLHSERLFATTSGASSEVWFSDDLDPTNWSVSLNDAGFIQLADERGEAKKVVSYNGYVYIFREQGISRLSASGGQEEFFLSHLFVSSGKIFGKTIALCGDKIVFVASDGIYLFNGSDTTKILEDTGGLIEVSQNSSAVYFNGKYYLSCHIDFGDDNYDDTDTECNAIFVLDAESREYFIYRGISAQSMAVVKMREDYKLVLLNGASDGSLENMFLVNSDESMPCRAKYITGLYDFGEASTFKTVRKVVAGLKSGESATIQVFNEEGEAVSVEVEVGTNLTPIIISGKSFGFCIEADEGVVFESLLLEVF